MDRARRDPDTVIYIVDDDDSVRRALSRLVRSVGLRAETFASPDELLRHGHRGEPGCLLLDVRLPGMSGFELHRRLLDKGPLPPAIFITAHPGERNRATARTADAVAFLEKPFDDQLLLDAIDSALSRGAVEGGKPSK